VLVTRRVTYRRIRVLGWQRNPHSKRERRKFSTKASQGEWSAGEREREGAGYGLSAAAASTHSASAFGQCGRTDDDDDVRAAGASQPLRTPSRALARLVTRESARCPSHKGSAGFELRL